MGGYVLRRILQTVPVLLGVSLLAFAVMHVVPGDPVRLIAGPDAPESVVLRIRTELGLDRPLYEQYASFLGRALRGDLGRSLRSRAPVVDEIVARFPATLELTTASMLIAVVAGVPLGLIAAVRRSTWVDYLATLTSLSTLSMPVFWLAIVAIWLFSLQLGWLPVSGRAGPPWQWDGFRHLVLPAVTLATTSLAITSRLTRSGMLEVLGREYVTTAWAKGLPPLGVVGKHALKNALIPVVTVVGLQYGFLLGGAVVTETIFAWPGVGRLAMTAILQRDYPVVQGCVLLVAVLFVLVNLLVDLLYGWLDPRIRFE
ncbi:MAG TPA: ABC transporter permease [Candidatus Dormibacteraeota bacterium]|nr:ABC transporter permease [Candidatus Dormibacteraeota bacterium]